MIPKVIHYCWFGGNPKPDLILKCLSSWSEMCPGYEIVEWNESNWDVEKYQFARDAYDSKKWAFVSDVARLDVLKTYGGIYLDTDIELREYDPFAPFLERDGLMAFETERTIATGLCFASCAGNPLLDALLEPYINKRFDPDNLKDSINSAMNMPVFSNYLHIEKNGKHQVIQNNEILAVGVSNNFAFHYGTRTWTDNPNLDAARKQYKNTWLKRALRAPEKFKFIEEKFGEGAILNIYTFIAYDLLENNPFYFMKRCFRKLTRKR